MASPPACTPPTSVPIFDPTDFTSVAGLYVNYPVAQGNLTLLGVACSGLNCSGSATAASLAVSGAASANSLTVSGDNTVTGVVRANGGIVMGGNNNITLGTGTALPSAAQIGYRVQTQIGSTFSVGTAAAALSSTTAIPAGVWLVEVSASYTSTTAWANLSLTTGTTQDFARFASGAAQGTVRLTTVVSNIASTTYNFVCNASAATTFANLYVITTRIA